MKPRLPENERDGNRRQRDRKGSNRRNIFTKKCTCFHTAKETEMVIQAKGIAQMPQKKLFCKEQGQK